MELKSASYAGKRSQWLSKWQDHWPKSEEARASVRQWHRRLCPNYEDLATPLRSGDRCNDYRLLL